MPPDRYITLPPLNLSDVKESIKRVALQDTDDYSMSWGNYITGELAGKYAGYDLFDMKGVIQEQRTLIVGGAPAYRVKYFQDQSRFDLDLERPVIAEKIIFFIKGTEKDPLVAILTYVAAKDVYSRTTADLLFYTFKERVGELIRGGLTVEEIINEALKN